MNPPTVRLEGIDHVALAVRDVSESSRWYQKVLGLEPRHAGVWNGVPTMLGVGTTMLALFPVSGAPRPAPGSDTLIMRHLAFRTDRDGFVQAKGALLAREIPFHFEDHEISHSIYFEDPDGHRLEITTYEV